MFDSRAMKSAPPLPEAIVDPSPADDEPLRLAVAEHVIDPNRFAVSRFRFRSLRHGCYLLRYTPKSTTTISLTHYDGTMRVERHGWSTTASGDLYYHFPRIFIPGSFSFATSPEPNPSAGIPIFPRARYSYYLRVTEILEAFTTGSSFTLGFEMHRYNRTAKTWSNEGAFTALMSWTSAPAGYPSGADYLEGDVKNRSNAVVARLTMGWVSPYLRRAVLEVDRYSASEYPGDNGSGVDWQDVFDQVGWDVTAYESDTNLSEPSGQSWSDSELHEKMVAKKDSADFDSEWRYHLLCVRRLDSTSRGIMYDAGGTDSNNLPREGAAISSHWTIPNSDPWGTVKGVRFGAAAAPYFRTAVHELGHAMGLRHNTADNGFMNTTGVIAGNAGTFPSNIQWSFNASDAKRLMHMSDAWVRPGEISWAPSYSAPISPDEEQAEAPDLAFRVFPLLDTVPLGAPVRIHLTLTNNGNHPAVVPDSLSLKSDHVSGQIIGPHGDVRTFSSIVHCIEDETVAPLDGGEQLQNDATLVRGADGALFPSAGLHRIRVRLTWEVDGIPVGVSAETSVMVTPPVDDAHASAARKVLDEPDTLLSLAIGGDHLKEGREAIDKALDNPVLRPHYAVVECKRLGQRFGKRAADPEKAAALIGKDTVLSGAEIGRLAEIFQGAKADARKKGKLKAAAGVLSAKVSEVSAADDVSRAVKKL